MSSSRSSSAIPRCGSIRTTGRSSTRRSTRGTNSRARTSTRNSPIPASNSTRAALTRTTRCPTRAGSATYRSSRTRFFNVYDVSVHRWGLDWNRLRHIFAPTVSYNWRPSPTVDRGSLQQFDALDAIDKQHFIRFNFENRVQTKEGKDLATRQIARVIPFFDLDYDTHRLDNIGYDAEFQPWPWLGIESDMIYDSVDQRVETANADLWFSRGAVSFAIGQRYLRDESMQTTTELRWRVNDEWEVRLYDRYEFETSENKENELTVSKAFDCVIVDFTYNHRDGDTFFVALRLAAFPDVPFGLSQTYNRPKTPAVTGIGSRRYT